MELVIHSVALMSKCLDIHESSKEAISFLINVNGSVATGFDLFYC